MMIFVTILIVSVLEVMMMTCQWRIDGSGEMKARRVWWYYAQAAC